MWMRFRRLARDLPGLFDRQELRPDVERLLRPPAPATAPTAEGGGLSLAGPSDGGQLSLESRPDRGRLSQVNEGTLSLVRSTE